MARLPAAPVRIGHGLDGPEPPEQMFCGNPDCDFAPAHDHHIVRRSHLGGPWDWVEIDGMVWRNTIGLCFSCHEDVEQLRASIELPDREEEAPYVFHWRSENSFKPLSMAMFPLRLNDAPAEPNSLSPSGEARNTPPSPGGIVEPGQRPPTGDEEEVPPISPGSTDIKGEPVDDSVVTGTATDPRHDWPPGEPVQNSPDLSPGSKCPTCQRRVNHPKRESSPKVTKQLNLGQAPSDIVDELRGRVELLAEAAEISALPHHRVKVIQMAIDLLDGIDVDTLRKVAREIPWAA